MATEDEVLALRRATDTPASDETYTYEVLSGILDDLGSVTAAAAAVWSEKAASYAGVVDTTESGSTRRLSQLHDQAIKMHRHFAGAEQTADSGATFTVGVERV